MNIKASVSARLFHERPFLKITRRIWFPLTVFYHGEPPACCGLDPLHHCIRYFSLVFVHQFCLILCQHSLPAFRTTLRRLYSPDSRHHFNHHDGDGLQQNINIIVHQSSPSPYFLVLRLATIGAVMVNSYSIQSRQQKQHSGSHAMSRFKSFFRKMSEPGF